MPKIKLFLVDGYGEYEDTRRIVEGFSDWEEVSDDDLNFLREHKWALKARVGENVIIVQQDDVPVEARIKGIMLLLEDQKKEEERRKEEERIRREKRQKNQEAKRVEKERKLLEKLQAKYAKGE